MSTMTTDRTSVSGDLAGATVQRRARRSTVRRLVSGVAAAVVLLLLAASPASAAINYYGAYASAFAGSSTVTHSFMVSPSTTPMTGWETGQAVSYRVAARDRTYATAGAWSTFAWQAPRTVTKSSTTVCSSNNDYDIILGGATACTNITADTSQTGLGSFTVNGQAGHRYEVIVQMAYLLGSGYSYSGWFATKDCANTYALQGGVTFPSFGATCAT